MAKNKEEKFCCSFCFKSEDEVDRLFVSFQEDAAICNECILLCLKGIFRETAEQRDREVVDAQED